MRELPEGPSYLRRLYVLLLQPTAPVLSRTSSSPDSRDMLVFSLAHLNGNGMAPSGCCEDSYPRVVRGYVSLRTFDDLPQNLSVMLSPHFY